MVVLLLLNTDYKIRASELNQKKSRLVYINGLAYFLAL